ncbi:YjgB family protein [Gorillibacterium sp. sgz500922]|uniref:YjgB family protein n=1 Tax=Gorillibacterium sp. sgz500922 TaxID=3446694 RepID=UPI003F67261A
MTRVYKTLTASLALAGALTLTACSSNGDGGTASPSASIPPSSASPATAAPTASAALPSASAPSASASPAPADTASPAAGGTAAPAASDVSKQIQEMMKLAKEGKAPGFSYVVHKSLIDDVYKDWGKADKEDPFGSAGIYSTYDKKNAVIGWNKGSQIFDIRSSAPELQKLTLKNIEGELGKPDDIKENGNDKIYIYHAGDEYQLKFIIPAATGKVDHISVFSPRGATNNMAN